MTDPGGRGSAWHRGACLSPGGLECLTREIDALLRDAVSTAGLLSGFANATGHSLGLDGITPRVSDFSCALHPGADWALKAGMVVHRYVSAGEAAISENAVGRQAGGQRLSSLPRAALRSS